ncbi:MAG: hypothetical protein LBQ62_00800 [Candidatus Accumulibacter sp.]|nr:hypothetical protein [Accumulibacter sp.]
MALILAFLGAIATLAGVALAACHALRMLTLVGCVLPIVPFIGMVGASLLAGGIAFFTFARIFGHPYYAGSLAGGGALACGYVLTCRILSGYKHAAGMGAATGGSGTAGAAAVAPDALFASPETPILDRILDAKTGQKPAKVRSNMEQARIFSTEVESVRQKLVMAQKAAELATSTLSALRNRLRRVNGNSAISCKRAARIFKPTRGKKRQLCCKASNTSNSPRS